MVNDIVPDEMSPRRDRGQHNQLPSRVKTFLRHNRNRPSFFLIPLLYAILSVAYFYGLLFRDVGSGVDIRQKLGTKTGQDSHVMDASTVKLWGSPEVDVTLDPRSLADVALANAEVARKNQHDREEYLKNREEIRKEREEERRKATEERLKKFLNGTVHTDESINLLQKSMQKSANSTANSTNLRGSKPIHRNPMKMSKERSQNAHDPGLFPVLIMIFSCTLLRLCISLTIGQFSEDSDNPDEGENERRIRRGGLNSFLTTMTGGREAARLRRRARQRHFQNFVDRLNAQRRINGERQISAEALRLVVSSRDFDPNDYDRLLQFNEENGPAIGSLFSVLGATEAEINRCPSRVLAEGDDLLKERRILGESGASGVEQVQTCSVCLEPYQLGDTVRTIPCFHTFHASCIDPWLAEKAECPICKHSAIG